MDFLRNVQQEKNIYMLTYNMSETQTKNQKKTRSESFASEVL